ncbi:MAG: hypothetical protein AABX11_00145, partial [Nanoarchaeota archaeon]
GKMYLCGEYILLTKGHSREYINQYCEVSGANVDVVREFDRLNSRIPKLSDNPHEATIQVKESLNNMGFSYGSAFTAQDVLRNKSGNCLGKPLLIATILGERGYRPKFQVAVNPKDISFKLEQLFFKHLINSIPFENPRLADKKEKFPAYRFLPLEHLVIDSDGPFLIETTSEEHQASEAESFRPVNFSEALSMVYKDRAVLLGQAGQLKKAMTLAEKGLQLYGENRQLHALASGIASNLRDGKCAKKHYDSFVRIDGPDSLYFGTLFDLNGNPKNIELALKRYPAFAYMIEQKARILANKDQKEAKWLFALASQMCANSQFLDLGDFKKRNKRDIRLHPK